MPFFLSHLSAKTYDQNNEKPRRNGQKRFPWSLVHLKFLNKTCTSNVFVEFLLREFIRWISSRKSASLAWVRVVSKWCHGHAQYVIQPCLHAEHVLESKLWIFVTRGSQAECDFALVKNLSFYRFGIRSCLATNDKQTLKDAIQHDVIVHFEFPGNITG